MAVCVSPHALAVEADLPGEQGFVLVLDQNGTVLPDAIRRPPLASGRISLVHVDIVNSHAPMLVVLTEDEDADGVWQLGLERRESVVARTAYPGTNAEEVMRNSLRDGAEQAQETLLGAVGPLRSKRWSDGGVGCASRRRIRVSSNTGLRR
jgi:hypothetical protein